MKNIEFKKGFTLIELMLVIAIVTLLSSVFFYSSSEARKKAEDAHMKVEADQIKTAITLYKEDTGFVPHQSFVADSIVYNESEVEYEQALSVLVPNYISEIPHSPSGNSYNYGYNEDYDSGLFVANLNNPPTGGNSNNNYQNSCGFVQPVAGTIIVYSPDDPNFSESCEFFMTDEICSPPDINGIINCTSPLAAWTCPIETSEPFCGGSTDTDYCQCI